LSVTVSKFVVNLISSSFTKSAFKETGLIMDNEIGFIILIVSPDHPLNSHPTFGTAVNFTTVP
jgi:hypothetical protein